MKRLIVAALLIVVGVTGIVSLAEAAPRGTITVSPATPTDGSFAIYTVEARGSNQWVRTTCAIDDRDVWWLSEVVDGAATVGPLGGPSHCVAEVGSFSQRFEGNIDYFKPSNIFTTFDVT